MENDEKRISLKEIVDEIFHSKYYIILFLFMSLVLTLYFAFYVSKPRWTGSLVIEELGNIEHADFISLKDFGEIYSVDRNYLNELFIEEVKDRDEASEIIDKIGIIDKSDFKNDLDYLYEVRKEAFQIEIYKQELEEDLLPDEKKKNYYVIEYSAYTSDDIVKIISYICSEANNKVQEFLTKKLSNVVETIDRARSDKINSIEIETENFLFDLKKGNVNRIAYLKEQSAIAKSLGMMKNQLEAQPVRKNEDIHPYYLRGYVAIDKEIELIESRVDLQSFSEQEYRNQSLPSESKRVFKDLEFEKRKIQQNNISQTLISAFEQSPISKKNFKSASYDTANIKVSRSDFGRLKILIIGSLIGLILSISSLIFKIYWKKGY